LKPSPARGDVRGRILDSALQLLADHGVSHLTQPRVSKAAGVRQSHLTYYFPTRPDLLLAVARHSMELLAAPLLEQAQQGRLRREQLPEVLAAALTDRRRMRVMLGVIAAADEDTKVRDALRELIGLIRSRLSAVLQALGLPEDQATVALLHTFVVGAAVLHHARADEAARLEVHDAIGVVMSLLPGLRAAPPTASEAACRQP
jgi:AcrR family transcriptional regulator